MQPNLLLQQRPRSVLDWKDRLAMGSGRARALVLLCLAPLWFQGQGSGCIALCYKLCQDNMHLSLLFTVATSRYEYDDHYFLTDPKEFIYEFFPLQPEWQLLKEPINLEEFEELPFVRSLFFRYQLAFPTQYMKSVMSTDQTGENFSLVSVSHLTNFRSCHGSAGDAVAHAVRPHLPLQPQVLQQGCGQL